MFCDEEKDSALSFLRNDGEVYVIYDSNENYETLKDLYIYLSAKGYSRFTNGRIPPDTSIVGDKETFGVRITDEGRVFKEEGGFKGETTKAKKARWKELRKTGWDVGKWTIGTALTLLGLWVAYIEIKCK
ncbi:hypothetical protein [Segetibacter aerophilus]|uniref:Uncharacterized protein n=1 Tax=Segetibacter aerophilus TaxID=670293 RepID=A0A512B9U7_9BACT|nr:hypothetical protein [Segetibacter aerophilus]GEO08713.1 hypothetical protein SAE01_12090 [Segetibacter aerophilus]